MRRAWAGRPRVEEALTGSLAPRDVAAALAAEACDAFGAAACSVHAAASTGSGDDGAADLVLAQHGEPLGLAEVVGRGGAAAQALAARAVVVIDDPARLGRVSGSLGAVVCAPLIVGARAIGVIALGLRERRPLDHRGRADAEAIASTCARAIERAQLYAGETQSERRFRSVFDYAVDAMLITDDARRIVDANVGATTLLRRTRQELVGRALPEITPIRLQERAERMWGDVLRAGTSVGELELEAGDGRTVLVEHRATAHVLPGRHLIVMRDIGARKRAEAMLQFLAEASAVLAGSLDYEATIASVTRLAVPTMGDWALVDMLAPDGSIERLAIAHGDPAKVRVAQELLRRWPQRFDDASAVARVIRTGRSEVHRQVSDEVLGPGAPGGEEPEQPTVTQTLGLKASMTVPLVTRGNALGALTLITSESGRHFDESDLTLAEDVGRRAAAAVENARSFRDAAAANRLKDEFLATMSHELRTPLGAILGWATILRADRHHDADLSKGLATIERNARAQVRLIEDVLDVSRIANGRLHLELSVLDATAVALAAIEVVRPLAEAKNIRVDAVVDDRPVLVLADNDRLLQVMTNLLSNGVKFTPRGGTIRLECTRRDPAACIIVSDTGQGIAPETLPFIFERFRQADSSTTRRHAGLGLGLTIARHLVDLHGGSITAHSRGEGLGASFTVVLPRASATQGAERPSQPAAPDESFDPSLVLEGLRVVACDDDPDTRDWLVRVLTKAGADVRLASSAIEAIRQVREFSPDVLVSDIGMPEVDGYALMERLRGLAVEDGSRTPSLALSAYARGADARRAIASGFQMHVAKPVPPGDLVARIAHLAGRPLRH